MSEFTKQLHYSVASGACVDGNIVERERCSEQMYKAALKIEQSEQELANLNAELTETIAAVSDLMDENERLRTDAAQLFIEEAHLVGGTFEARMQSKIGSAIVDFIRETMKMADADNFVTTQLTFGTPTGTEGPYYLTFGRADGKTVSEKYGEVHKENTDLRRQLAEAYERCAQICNRLADESSTTFVRAMSESIEENKMRIARMQGLKTAEEEIRALIPKEATDESTR